MKTQRSLRKVLHDALYKLDKAQSFVRAAEPPDSLIRETIIDINELIQRGVGNESSGLKVVYNAGNSTRHTLVEIERYLSEIKANVKDRSQIFPALSFSEIVNFEQALREVIDGLARLEPTATLEQTGPTIVLYEMELWEACTDHMGRTILCDASRTREAIDLETDTYPLTMPRINYSVLFKEQWDGWCSDNEDRPFANRDQVEQKVLAYWREAMTQVDINSGPKHDGPEAYHSLLMFLNEVDITSRRMQTLLVQDVPIFQRDTTTRQSA